MPFTEDLNAFYTDWGVPVQAGAVNGLGVLDSPSQYLQDGRVINDELLLRCQTSQFGNLAFDASITVNGTPYLVMERPMRVGDGAMCLVLLKPAPPSPAGEKNLTTVLGVPLTTVLGVPLKVLS